MSFIEFTTREQATFIILFLCLIIVIYINRDNNVREIPKKILELFKFPIMWIQVFLVGLICCFGFYFNQNLIMWTLFFALPYMFRCSDIVTITLDNYKKRIFSIISVSLIIEVVVGLKTFSLWLEILIQFIFLILTLIICSAQNMKNKGAVGIFNGINVLINLVFIYRLFISSNLSDYQNSFTTMLFTFCMSLLIYVVGYLLNVIYRYQNIFGFISRHSKEKLGLKEFGEIFKYSHVNIDRIQLFRKKMSRNTFLLDKVDRIDEILRYDETRILGRANILE